LVDYHEASGVGLDEYARVLDAKAKEHGWIYGFHYFPHDVAHRELGNHGLSRVDTLNSLGIKPKHPAVGCNVNDQINAVRRLLDAAWIDEKRCERGLNALRNYRREWVEKLKMFADAPKHDWASHGASALASFATQYREAKEKVSAPVAKIPEFGTDMHSRGTGWLMR